MQVCSKNLRITIVIVPGGYAMNKGHVLLNGFKITAGSFSVLQHQFFFLFLHSYFTTIAPRRTVTTPPPPTCIPTHINSCPSHLPAALSVSVDAGSTNMQIIICETTKATQFVFLCNSALITARQTLLQP